MNERFAEYDEVSVTELLRQGDVLEAVDAGATMWQRHLLVMTADCDFAHEKHRGRVTCVPLLAADEYLAEMQIPKIREQLVKPRMDELQQALSKAQAPPISYGRLREWASEADPENIVSQLGLGREVAEKVRCNLEAVRQMDAPAENLGEYVELLVAGQLAGTNPPKPERARKRVDESLRSAYTQPPGDALFLSAIGPGLDSGYFAYLRHIEQIWQPDIAIAPTRAAISHRRLSRMKERFTLALTQRFAMVFMSIGLPEQYEENRNLYADFPGEYLK
ncbi:hypothetical protein ACFVT9_38240 [Kitasatospora cineracea]|uniref:hypothetical protein n=1 Tax=Kitasatospora cineracea TaxID=88074 RepID=UPI0036DF9911